METKYNEEIKGEVLVPETPLEAVEHLEEFFRADMWYAKGAEWKTEEDMLNYLTAHFKICKETIIGLTKED